DDLARGRARGLRNGGPAARQVRPPAPDQGKPVARRGRKARSLATRETVRLPEHGRHHHSREIDMRRILILSLAFPLYLSTQAAAQTCTGMPAFTSGHMQIAGGGQFQDGASGFSGTFGYGTPKSLYGKAGIGTTSYDAFDGSSFDFNVGGGYQIPLHSSRTAELCPIASLGLSSGPNDVLGSGVD